MFEWCTDHWFLTFILATGAMSCMRDVLVALLHAFQRRMPGPEGPAGLDGERGPPGPSGPRGYAGPPGVCNCQCKPATPARVPWVS